MFLDLNLKPFYPRPDEAFRVLNDSCCNSSSTEAGVLIAYHQATADPSRRSCVVSLDGGSILNKYCCKNLSVGVWCKQSNTQDNGERRFIYKYVGKHAAQRSSHQLPSSHCGRSSKVISNGSTTYRSVSNSLLARTADRIPKTFALQGDPSRPTQPPSSKRSPYIVFPADCDVTWNDLAHSWCIFSPNRDIEKIPVPSRSHISSPKKPNLSQNQGSRLGYCPSSHTYPCKTLFPTIRLTLLGSDFPCL
ncbi:hypothetical protein AVEN_41973-1 [Araneus ventricosus]|uniref:Uncharacterized protein n=1 Tax=Araneus ventricosus TaxID=182803 RepID=A0A4Y2TH33_ARAVE|nr:hypothetical protein AVEN_41973-1 [Araneus ventricosus]